MPLARGTRLAVVLGSARPPVAEPEEEEMIDGGEQGANMVPAVSTGAQDAEERTDEPEAPATEN